MKLRLQRVPSVASWDWLRVRRVPGLRVLLGSVIVAGTSYEVWVSW